MIHGNESTINDKSHIGEAGGGREDDNPKKLNKLSSLLDLPADLFIFFANT
jgi:hypothetical protein